EHGQQHQRNSLRPRRALAGEVRGSAPTDCNLGLNVRPQGVGRISGAQLFHRVPSRAKNSHFSGQNMGRPRKTVAELKRAGTYRPCRHGSRAAEETAAACESPTACETSPPAVPAPLSVPADLAGVAAGWWVRLAAALVGRLEASDGPLLARACEWLAEAERCKEKLAELSPGDVEHGRVMRSMVAADAAANGILGKYGLSP